MKARFSEGMQSSGLQLESMSPEQVVLQSSRGTDCKGSPKLTCEGLSVEAPEQFVLQLLGGKTARLLKS